MAISLDVISLSVGIATLVVTIRTFIYTRNKDKRHIKSLIKRKKAQLKSMEMSERAGFNISEIGGLSANIAALKADIQQLEEEL